MTDIAAIFHWPLSEMLEMDIIELADWRERAVNWWNAHRVEKKG